ncbi:MAG: Maf family protein, partial [Planctomycetes bacterium]|nr:Maf family protein [Planctomycetota bacterium]
MSIHASPRLVLASASPRRRELVARLGIPFETLVPAGVDEASATGNAVERAGALAALKAQAGLAQHPDPSA